MTAAATRNLNRRPATIHLIGCTVLRVEDTAIYGPKPGQPPVFTIDGVSVCLAEVAGIRAVLATGAVDEDHARQTSTRLVTELADWLDLSGFAAISEDHYRKFHRVGSMTAHSGQPGEWPFTFTVNPAGTVILYPAPHKESATLNGWLIGPHPPALFSAPVIDGHHYPRGSDQDHLAQHLAALLALHRIKAAITVHAGDRTYRAPGTSVIGARIYYPGESTGSATQQQWLHAVLSAVTAVPQITAHPDPQPPVAGLPPDVLVEYHRPHRPWTIYAIDTDAAAP